MAYVRTEWKKGDVIDAEKLGNIENGIFSALNGLQHLTGKEYDRNKTDADNLPTGINLSGNIAGENITATGNIAGENITATGNIAGGGNLTIGDSNNPNNKTTALYTNTVNYGALTIGGQSQSDLNAILKVNGGLAVGNSESISENTTWLHTNTNNYGNFTVGTETLHDKITTLWGPLYAKNDVIIGTATTENDVTTYTNTATFNANTTFNGNTIANGTLTIKNPTENLHAATKWYIDNIISNLSQQTITGFGSGKTLASLTESDGIINATFTNIVIPINQVTALADALNSKASLSGATFVGQVSFSQDYTMYARGNSIFGTTTTVEHDGETTINYNKTVTFNTRSTFNGPTIINNQLDIYSCTYTDLENNEIEYYSATINNDGILARNSIAVQNKTSSILTTCISYDGISFIQNNIPKNLISYNDMADMIIIGDNDLITSILGQQLLVSGNIKTTVETTGNEDGKQGYIYDYSLITEDRIGNLILKCNGTDSQSNALLNTPMLLSYQPWGFETGEVLALGGPAMDAAVSDSNCVTDTFIRAKNSITLAPRNGRVNTKSDLSITSGNNLIMYNGTSQVSLSGAQLAAIKTYCGITD